MMFEYGTSKEKVSCKFVRTTVKKIFFMLNFLSVIDFFLYIQPQ